VPGGVRVIEQAHAATGGAPEDHRPVLVFPLLTQVAHGADAPVLDDAGEAEPDWALPLEMARDLAGGGESLLQGAWRFDLHAVALRQQAAGLGVHGRALEGRPADIDAENFHAEDEIRREMARESRE
jgi:hypothetical protein